MFSSLGNHVDVPEYILMAVFYRFICNLQIAIRDRKKYSSDQGKIRDMSSRLSEYISEEAVLKKLSWSLYFENRKDLFI